MNGAAPAVLPPIMSGQRRDLDATRDAAALAWAEQYADILSHDAVSVCKLNLIDRVVLLGCTHTDHQT